MQNIKSAPIKREYSCTLFWVYTHVTKAQLTAAVNSPHRLNSWVWVLILQLGVGFPVEVKSPVEHSHNWPLGGIVLKGLPVYHIHDGGHNSGPAQRQYIHVHFFFTFKCVFFSLTFINQSDSKKNIPVSQTFGRIRLFKILNQQSLITFSLIIQSLCAVRLVLRKGKMCPH